MSEDRPNPDALLAAIQKEEKVQARGKLKVFLGMAAGAGKTYAMLEEAIRKQKEGLDVLIGYVETHGRKETDALAQKLPTLPRKTIKYKEVDLQEFDLDAGLARRPQLILVDELAHTNVPGSRHPKRYQDIRELLHAGINVYTTLNVQHVESRADTVEQVTGSRTLETVPDSILDEAQIELIDISPQDLLKRLDEGKVYVPERAAIAMVNFFREGNLTALREMALRLAAERVGQDVHEYMQVMQISGPWKTGHRLLVAVSPSPLAAQMVRWTRRLADSWDCPWIAVYVEPSRALSEAAQSQLTKNLNLARELGAEVITTSDDDLVRGIMRIARRLNATQIIVGKPVPGPWFHLFRRKAFLSKLVEESGDIDVHVVRAEKGDFSKLRTIKGVWGFQWKQYAVATGVVAGVGIFNSIIDPLVGYRALALNFLFAVVLLSLFAGRGAVILAATLSALVWNYFFLPPRYTFFIRSFDDALMFIMYFVIAVVLGHLVARMRQQEQAERRREQRSSALYLLSRDLANATSVHQVIETLVGQIRDVFHADAAVVLAENPKTLSLRSHAASGYLLSQKEYGVAAWVFHNGKAAGKFTDNLPAAEALHVPLATPRETLGILSVRIPGDAPLPLDQRNLLDAFARQAALVLDRQELQDSAERSRLSAESERLGKTLLDSISHEMRTPIAAISSALNFMRQTSDESTRSSLLAEVQTAAERLNRLVANLLNATRVESGNLRPNLEWQDPPDVINVVLKSLQKELSSHKVILHVPAGLPLVRIDFSLMEQVFTNLILNAATHTPTGTTIQIGITQKGSELQFSVADSGPGIPEECLAHIFEKFYRVPGTPAGGSGLGLSIAKGFVEAQGGSISAENQKDGGALFTVRMPLESQPEIPQEAA